MNQICLFTVAALALIAGGALAAGMDHSQHQALQGDPFGPIMQTMHRDMPAPTGNIDRDFLAGMIPHHQAAVDMAKVELAQGHDPKVKAFAQQILDAQTAEIAQMHTWLNQPAAMPSH